MYEKLGFIWIQLGAADSFVESMFLSPKYVRYINFFFQGFLSQTLTIHRTAGKKEDHVPFLSTTSTRTFRHLFATLHAKWLPHIFNRIACNYQATTRWDVTSFRITIWLIDDAMIISICLLYDLILGFCCSNLTWKNGGFELASNITLALQANQLTKDSW